MGLLNKMLNRDLPVTSKKAWSTSFWNLMSRSSNSGQSVDEFTALNYSAVFNAISIISGTIGSLPLHLYLRTPEGKRKLYEHPKYELLHFRPNPEMTAMTLRETGAAHVLSWGNMYFEKVHNKLNEIVELWPIPPNIIKVFRESGVLYYDIYIDGQVYTFDRRKILHIPGLGFDGLQGYSVVAMAREAIGLGLATEEFGARFFGNGAHPGTVVSHPGVLSQAAHENLKKDLINKYSGLGKSHKLMLLDEGMKIENIGVPPNDSQFLETRQFQIPEIARWFNIDPSKLKDHSRSTFNNIEQLQINHVVECIRPWLVRIEQHYNTQILTLQERQRGMFYEHNIEGLLRGDHASRSEFYRSMFNMGALSINEIREKENLNRIPNGDERFFPLNMAPLSKMEAYVEMQTGKTNIDNNSVTKSGGKDE